jgi:hypothetical protein
MVAGHDWPACAHGPQESRRSGRGRRSGVVLMVEYRMVILKAEMPAKQPPVFQADSFLIKVNCLEMVSVR